MFWQQAARRAASGGAALARERVCVVQGASRGIGLELSRQLAARGDVVFATCRRPEAAAELQALRAAHPERVAVLRLDVAEPESIAAAAEEFRGHQLALAAAERSAVAAGRAASEAAARVDILLNVAGVLQDEARGIVPERALTRVDAVAVAAAFASNATGPLLVAGAFSPLLRRAASEAPDDPGSCGARAVFYSARVGSIGDNATGGWYSYRASKAALNQFVRCMALELKRQRVCCVALHPGTVDTDLTRSFLKARSKYDVQTVEDAARGHLGIVDSLRMQDSGSFLDWKRAQVPW